MKPHIKRIRVLRGRELKWRWAVYTSRLALGFSAKPHKVTTSFEGACRAAWILYWKQS